MRLPTEVHMKLIQNFEATMKATREKDSVPDHQPVVKFIPTHKDEGLPDIYVSEYDRYTESFFCIQDSSDLGSSNWWTIEELSDQTYGYVMDSAYVPDKTVREILGRSRHDG